MRRLMLLLVAVVVLTTGMAEAQPRLGVLLFGTPATDPNVAAFRRGLSDLGYVEGRNIVLEYRYAEGKAERLPDLARELVSLKPNIIFALGGDVAPAVKSATATIPVVVSVSLDPVQAGLVGGLARPGGNITGVTFVSSELAAKRLVIVATSRQMLLNRQQIIELAAKHRILLVSGWGPWAQAGALLSYGPDVDAMIRRAAIHVDKILKGAKPGELPIEQPTKFELVINLKTARAFELTIPPSLAARADRVVE